MSKDVGSIVSHTQMLQQGARVIIVKTDNVVQRAPEMIGQVGEIKAVMGFEEKTPLVLVVSQAIEGLGIGGQCVGKTAKEKANLVARELSIAKRA